MQKIVDFLSKKLCFKNEYNIFQKTNQKSISIEEWDKTDIYCFIRFSKNIYKNFYLVKMTFITLVDITKVEKYQTIILNNQEYYITNASTIKIYISKDNMKLIKNTLMYEVMFNNKTDYNNLHFDCKQIRDNSSIKDLGYNHNNLSKPDKHIKEKLWLFGDIVDYLENKPIFLENYVIYKLFKNMQSFYDLLEEKYE